MTFAQAVGRNTIIQFVGKAVGTVLGLVTTAIIQRYLNPTGYGAYISAMAYLGFFSVIADLGLYLILIRDISKPNADQSKIVGNLLALRWVSAAIILGIGLAAVFFVPFTGPERMAVLIGTWSFVAVAATQLLVGIFQSKLAMGKVAIAELAGRVILLTVTALVAYNHGSLTMIMAAVVAGSITNFLLVWLAARKYVSLRLRFDWDYWKHTLRETLPIAISIVLNLIYFRADTIILRLMKTEYDVGLYGAAYKILEILNTFPVMFVGLVLPALAAAFGSNDRERFARIFQQSFNLLLMAAVPMLIGGWVLAAPALNAIGQSAYIPAAPVLRLLLIAVTALFLGSLSGHTVTIINRQRQMVWSYLSVAVVGLMLYLTLIPRFSLYGAATGTIVTESLTAIVGYVLILKVMRLRLSIRILGPLAICGAVIGGVAWLLRGQNFWLAAAASGVAYVIALMATRTLNFSTIRGMLSRPGETIPTIPGE